VSKYTVRDKRQPSNLITSDLDANMRRLRQAGHTLPKSNILARKETENIQASVHNRTLIKEMARGATGAGTRTASNVQMALPKIRKPMSSLEDKGIPFDTSNPRDLKEIRRWARLFVTTHDLVPLLVDIYSKFPVVGMEFVCKDPMVKDFYEEMFIESLDYENFLQDLGREYFTAGEITSLAHFNETLGIWSAEEILNPDNVAVSKSLFQPKERVQLLVKEMVEALRRGPQGLSDEGTTPSEQLEQNAEYQRLATHYPEIIEAAARNDGLDLSDALVSRIVNKASAWDLRGTPHIMRSFRTLMLEESLNAAQDAVADRLYSPFILATLGIPNLGDGEPWIPDQVDLDETRDDMQNALAADFRLMVHNFGLDIKSVFGREAVPRFDADYSRVDRKLMQAWGIGEALISGGTSQTYAGSAINREFVTQMMLSYQNSVKRHMRHRMEIIAEAQEHFDYEKSGTGRKVVYRQIVETDDEGNEMLIQVPKLLIPEVRFQTINLRDEAQERQFLQQLKQNGVPISDATLAVNIPMDFKEELEKKSDETVQKLLAEAQAMNKAYLMIKEMGLPMPPELAKYMAAKAQLEKVENEAEDSGTATQMAKDQHEQFQETGIMPGAPGAAGEGGGPNDMDNGVEKSLDQGGEDENLHKIKTPKAKPRNRTRPAESDEQRSNSPKAAHLRFWEDPSSLHTASKVTHERAQAAVERMANPNPSVKELVQDEGFYDALNQTGLDFDQDYEDLEIYHFNKTGSTEVAVRYEHLSELLEQYELVYGVQPEWN
jgi:hypothetical protein